MRLVQPAYLCRTWKRIIHLLCKPSSGHWIFTNCLFHAFRKLFLPRLILLPPATTIWTPGAGRGTQRLFSVKYLFVGEKTCLEFSIAWGRTKKILDNHSIHVQFSKLFKLIPYNFLKLSYFTPHVKLFFEEKGNLKFSVSRMRWREESELPSKKIRKSLFRHQTSYNYNSLPLKVR